jgi:hypothetical protein
VLQHAVLLQQPLTEQVPLPSHFDGPPVQQLSPSPHNLPEGTFCKVQLLEPLHWRSIASRDRALERDSRPIAVKNRVFTCRAVTSPALAKRKTGLSSFYACSLEVRDGSISRARCNVSAL